MQAELLAALLLCSVRISVSRRYGPSIDKAALQLELDTNRAKWLGTGIKSYVLKQSVFCAECSPQPGPLDITVLNGNMSGVTFSRDSRQIGAPNVDNGLFTVEGAFHKIQASLDYTPSVSGLAVAYNATLGYVTSLSICIDVKVVDDELRFEFELLKVVSSGHGTDGQAPIEDQTIPPVLLPAPVLLPSLVNASPPCPVTSVQHSSCTEASLTSGKISTMKINRCDAGMIGSCCTLVKTCFRYYAWYGTSPVCDFLFCISQIHSHSSM